MEKFIAEFDPLATLDAEYAAVVAQTRPSSKEPANGASEEGNQAENDQVEPAQSDEEDDDEEDSMGEELYALLPTSPAGSDDGFDDDDDEANEAETGAASTPEPASLAPPQPMDAATKQTIMVSMQSMRLQPPPWAIDTAIGDDELIELVQKRLQLRADAAASRTEG